MGYCKIHGQFVSHRCSDCADAEERKEAARAEMLERLEELRDSAPDADEIAYAINNPGEHVCPFCRFRTLRLDASRCAKCHSDISPDHWAPIRRQLALQRQAEEMQAKIVGEARAQAAAQAAQAAAREENERRRRSNKARFAMIYFGYLVPVLTLVSCITWANLFMDIKPGAPSGGDFLMLVPGLNWLGILGACVGASKNFGIIRAGFVFWMVVGFFIYRFL